MIRVARPPLVERSGQPFEVWKESALWNERFNVVVSSLAAFPHVADAAAQLDNRTAR